MSYSNVAPVALNSVHPSLPTLRVPSQVTFAPDAISYIWVIGTPSAVSAPVSPEEVTVINARLDAIEAAPPPDSTLRYYSKVSITNAEALGKNSFTTPVEGNSFYAVFTDNAGIATRAQLWSYIGTDASIQWKLVGDTEGSESTQVLDDITALRTDVDELQIAAGSQVEGNVTIKYETGTVAPSQFVMPASIIALDPSQYDNGEIVRVMFDDAYCDYQHDGVDWIRLSFRVYNTAGDTPPAHPHPTARIQSFTVEEVRYYGELKEGGDITVSMLNVANGAANWILPGQQYGLFHHSAIMHMAQEGSEWHLYQYTGYNIGNGAVGGAFTLTDGNATVSQKQASPLSNPAFTEHK